jgi:hypothetical protein
MAYIDKEKAIQEILELFENQLNLLTRKDKLEKMELRRKIRDVIQPTIRMNIVQPKIYMEIIEDKLDDVIGLFCDGVEFKKKLAYKMEQTLKRT